MPVKRKMKKWTSARQKYPRGCICGTWSLRCKDCVTSSFTSCLFSSEIFNTKLSRYPEDDLYARHGSRSCKNTAQARKVTRWKGRWPSTAARSQENYQRTSNICLQTPIWKVSCHRSIISSLLGSFNGKWQDFSMVCSESDLRLVELFTFPGKTKSLQEVKLGELAWERSPQK